MSKHFIKEDKRSPNKQRKRYITLLIIKEMKIKYKLAWPKLKSLTIPSVDRNVDAGENVK